MRAQLGAGPLFAGQLGRPIAGTTRAPIRAPEPQQQSWTFSGRDGLPPWQFIAVNSAKKMVLCCCWPVHKCVTVLSLFDTVLVSYFCYQSFLLLADTIDDPHWLAIVSFLFLAFFLVCQVIATVFIILAHKKNLAHYCLPRLVLITGLLICSTVGCLILMVYFGGAAGSMNRSIFSTYDYFFPGELDDQHREEMTKEMHWYAIGFFALSLTYAIYNLFVLLLTRKFYQHLNQFRPLPQNEPSVPAYNPEFPPKPPHHGQDPAKGGNY